MFRSLAIMLAMCLVSGCATHSRPRITDAFLQQFPKGTEYSHFEKESGLSREYLDLHMNQPIGHEQGWFHLPEGDVMVSASESSNGVWSLDQTPWILERREQPTGGDSLKAAPQE